MYKTIDIPDFIASSPHALEAWNQLLAVRAELNLQPKLHRSLMVGYCQAVDELRQVCMELPQGRALYTKAGGKVVLSTRLMALDRLARQVMSISQSLGISPPRETENDAR